MFPKAFIAQCASCEWSVSASVEAEGGNHGEALAFVKERWAKHQADAHAGKATAADAPAHADY